MTIWDRIDNWFEKRAKRGRRAKIRRLRNQYQKPEPPPTPTDKVWIPSTILQTYKNGEKVTEIKLIHKLTLKEKHIYFKGHIEADVVRGVLKEGGYL